MLLRRVVKLFSTEFPSDWDVHIHHVGAVAVIAVFLSAVSDKLGLTDSLPTTLKVGVFSIFVALFSMCIVYLMLRVAYVLVVSCCRRVFSTIRSALHHIAQVVRAGRRPPNAGRSAKVGLFK